MIMVFIVSVIGALLTFEFAKHSRVGAIRASAGLSLIFALIAKLIFIPFEAQVFSAIFFGGSFVGMSSPERISRAGVLWAAILFVFVFELLREGAVGMGGALGFSAFIAVGFAIFKAKIYAFIKRKLND